MPAPRTCSRMSRTWRMAIGDNPLDGSSISSNCGRRHQRAADCDHLLFAAAEAAGKVAAPIAQEREAPIDVIEPAAALRGWERGRRRAASCPRPTLPEKAAGPRDRAPGRDATSASVGAAVISSPFQSTVPPVRGARPINARSNVDLPAPLAPNTETDSPRSTRSDTPRSARRPPNDTASSVTSRSGMDQAPR